jgi:hypothetical protein
MDLVKILNDAIERLPSGEHSAGLTAIMRHISVAIKHFERRDENGIDSFTDAIYRTNQAYEGSLKEAYRVLAGKDPSVKTPNEIEKYLEGAKVVRPRVLTQLTRYRQDYRNPSTHDYKLDFDQNEAILAIVSVCAFAKLLIDQISERLAFEAAAAAPPPDQVNAIDFDDPDSFVAAVAHLALDYANSTSQELNYWEFEGGLAGRITSLGLKVDIQSIETEEFLWDIAVSSSTLMLPVETRIVSRDFDPSEPHGLLYLAHGAKRGGHPSGLGLLYGAGGNPYHLYKVMTDDFQVYMITRYPSEEIKKMDRGAAKEVIKVR